MRPEASSREVINAGKVTLFGNARIVTHYLGPGGLQCMADGKLESTKREGTSPSVYIPVVAEVK